RFGKGRGLDPAGSASSGVRLESELRGEGMRLRLPQAVWRGGIDLNPLHAADPADRRWLSALVWPGEDGRAERIERALDVVAADPPVLVRGDATVPGTLADLAERAPSRASLVVTAPGILPLLGRTGRDSLLRGI